MLTAKLSVPRLPAEAAGRIELSGDGLRLLFNTAPPAFSQNVWYAVSPTVYGVQCAGDDGYEFHIAVEHESLVSLLIFPYPEYVAFKCDGAPLAKLTYSNAPDAALCSCPVVAGLWRRKDYS